MQLRVKKNPLTGTEISFTLSLQTRILRIDTEKFVCLQFRERLAQISLTVDFNQLFTKISFPHEQVGHMSIVPQFLNAKV